LSCQAWPWSWSQPCRSGRKASPWASIPSSPGCFTPRLCRWDISGNAGTRGTGSKAANWEGRMRIRLQTACLAALLWHLPASASDEWLPVRETTLAVEAGSPLDFSGILANQPIDGANNRLISGDGGHTATAALPARPKRFHCASLGWSPASGGFPDHPTADLYARQLAMRGYNMAR